MSTLPSDLLMVLSLFAPLMTQPTWRSAQVLLVGAILAPGGRTVSAILRVMGRGNDEPFHKYHRVLNRAPWSPWRGSRLLLEALVKTFVPDGPLVLGLDDTIERRWGKRITAKGIYRDPVRSSHSFFAKTAGLRWLSLMVLADIPWAGRIWALPILTALCPSERFYEAKQRHPRTLLERGQQLIRAVRRWRANGGLA